VSLRDAASSRAESPDVPGAQKEGEALKATERAALLCGVSKTYVEYARGIREADREMFEQVRLGRVNISQARLAVSKKIREKAMPAATPARARGNPNWKDDELHVGDCLARMKKMPDKCMKLVFADGPYNLGLSYDSDPTRDQLPDDQFLEWSDRWIRHGARLLSSDGSMFVLINDRYAGRYEVLLRNAGLHWRNTIVWNDPFPNHTDGNFQPSAKFLFYFTKSPTKFIWNPDQVREPSERDKIGDERRVHDKGRVMHNVWNIPRIVGNSAERIPFAEHPPQLPEELIARCIRAASNEGDRVFDPFTGNGTTWRTARKLGRKFTGIERSPLYAEQARKWADSIVEGK
jgi:DNA modification methylase